ncbi:MAG: Fur family transcriptional regulator [Actinomycetes bacterium]
MDTLDAELRAAGLKVTAQRRLVFGIVRDLRHATPDQIRDAAGARGHSLDLSTVYRTLDKLDDVGLITHAHLGPGSATYHPIDARPHGHLVCRECGSVSALDADLLEPLLERIRGSAGFEVDVTHIALHGMCGTCAAAAIDGKR